MPSPKSVGTAAAEKRLKRGADVLSLATASRFVEKPEASWFGVINVIANLVSAEFFHDATPNMSMVSRS